MKPKEKTLVERAVRRHEKIFPIAGRQDFKGCFTEGPHGELCFWYDTPDGSSHVIYDSIVPTLKKKRVYYSLSMCCESFSEYINCY